MEYLAFWAVSCFLCARFAASFTRWRIERATPVIEPVLPRSYCISVAVIGPDRTLTSIVHNMPVDLAYLCPIEAPGFRVYVHSDFRND